PPIPPSPAQTHPHCAPRAIRPVHGIACYPAGIDDTADGEPDLVAAQPAVLDRCADTARPQSAGKHLELLPEREQPQRQAPRTGYLGRHDIQMRGAPASAVTAYAARFVRIPAFYLEAVGDDTGARLQVKEFGSQHAQVFGKQEQRQDGRLRDFGLIHVTLDELDSVGHALSRSDALRPVNQVRVVFHAESPRSALGGGDDTAAVA